VNTQAIACLWLAQVEPSPIASGAMRAFVMTAVFMAFVVTAMVVIFRYFRAQRDGSQTAKMREEFNKSKDILLATAMSKKQAHDQASGTEREATADEKERDLLLENVDPQLVLGQVCPLCGLELSADEELIIDPYTGMGCHLSDFLNDWPLDEQGRPRERPKFVYRYPQGTVVRSSDLIRGF
jgi:hypothetical protein